MKEAYAIIKVSHHALLGESKALIYLENLFFKEAL